MAAMILKFSTLFNLLCLACFTCAVFSIESTDESRQLHETCTTPVGSGHCHLTSTCARENKISVPGYCPGAADIQCCIMQTCHTPSGSGSCISKSSCSSESKVSVPGYCPGSSDIECCIPKSTKSCETPYGKGTCLSTSSCANAKKSSIPGYCPGSDDIQCCIANAPAAPISSLGVDISTQLSRASADCLRKSGYSYVIPRGYQSIGEVDPNVCISLKSAATAGIPVRDVYLFPSPKSKLTATQQVRELVAFLNTCKSSFSGRIWLDIEGASYWKGSMEANRKFYRELVDACQHGGVKCGIYSSPFEWRSVLGEKFSYGTWLPLWYAHYDNLPTFSDWPSIAFGGWKTPFAKQYRDTTTICGVGVDFNYSPNFSSH